MTSGQAKKKQEIQAKLQLFPNFTPQKILIKTGISTIIPKGLSIDQKSQQICLIDGDTVLLYPFTSVIETEIVIDGTTVTKTSRGSQAIGIAVGAALAGGLGAAIGGISGSTTTSQKIKNVFLRITLNDLDLPIHEIEFIELTNTGSTVPQAALREADQWNNILKVLIFQGQGSST